MSTPVETSDQIERAAALWAVKDYPLTPEDDTALQAWLAGDTRRRGALLRAQAAWEFSSRARALGPSEDWQDTSAASARALPRRKVFAAAAAAAGLIAATVVVGVNLRGDEALTRAGEIRRLPMRDGSIATLNTESRLRINMAETERRIELVKGEAWFKVAKNKDRPFIVAAGSARIRAVGTAFSVKRRADGVEVLVTEGTVRVWSEGKSGANSASYLSAGDRTVISENLPVRVNHAPDAIDSDLAWREGQISLNGKSLLEVAEEFNRYNRLQLVIRDRELANERLVGRLSANDPEAFSSAVAQSFDVDVSRTDKFIVLDKKN